MRQPVAQAGRPQPVDAQLECTRCGRSYPKDVRLACDDCPDALLRSAYAKTRFEPQECGGIFRFRQWLPSSGIETSSGPAAFASEAYGPSLGLRRLIVGFNGYWPERGAYNMTGTFKDLEATPTLAFFREHGRSRMVVASAGNTARAFAYACAEADFDCWLVVPEKMFHRLWLPRDPAGCVRTIAVEGSRDYYAAIRIAEDLARRFDLTPEGGARNVARRDGLGTTVLECLRLTKQMPDHYVQAVGSGTGGIAAYEAATRLAADGRFGVELPRLHLAQNLPFAPMCDAWSRDEALDAEREPNDVQLKKIAQMYASVLANTHPPYNGSGGVREVLRATRGQMYAVRNDEARAAGARFAELEGIDISPPAACACAALEQALSQGEIESDALVLLNITGGGYERLRAHHPVRTLQPDRLIAPDCDVDSLRDLFD